MQDLRALALHELGSQLSKDNIVAEIFTHFTSQYVFTSSSVAMLNLLCNRYDDVRELEVRVLKEHWAELKGTVEMSDMLKKVVRCNMPHATAIMGALW